MLSVPTVNAASTVTVCCELSDWKVAVAPCPEAFWLLTQLAAVFQLPSAFLKVPSVANDISAVAEIAADAIRAI